MAALEYPLVVPKGAEPPLDGPRPYMGENDDDHLAYFRYNATGDEWKRYNRWVTEQAETRRPSHAELVTVYRELITNSDVFTLRHDEYIMDNILHFVVKSLKDKLGMEDQPVAFFPSFFLTKLFQVGHVNPQVEGQYCYEGVASWTKSMLRGRLIDQMKTIVFFLNQTRYHWICFAIFMDLRIIQSFDSMGGAYEKELQGLYRWLHETMLIQGKHLNASEWRLYPTRSGTPTQTYADCGLYTVLFAMCVAKRYSLQIITRERIKAARCLLLLELINLQPEKAEPLTHGPVGTSYMSWVKHPFHYDRESLPYYESGYFPYFTEVESMTPPTKTNPPASMDLCTPEKNLFQETPESVLDLVTPDKRDGEAVGMLAESPVDLMTPPTKTNPSATFDLITPKKTSDQKRKESVFDLVTPPKQDRDHEKWPTFNLMTPPKQDPDADADADAGESNEGGGSKKGVPNPESSTNKENSGTGNENDGGGSSNNCPGAPSAGGGGGGSAGGGGSDGNGGDDPNKDKPGDKADKAVPQRKKPRRRRPKRGAPNLPTRSSPRHKKQDKRKADVLESATPTKTKLNLDDHLSRIDPSEPIVPFATLPARTHSDSVDEDDGVPADIPGLRTENLKGLEENSKEDDGDVAVGDPANIPETPTENPKDHEEHSAEDDDDVSVGGTANIPETATENLRDLDDTDTEDSDEDGKPAATGPPQVRKNFKAKQLAKQLARREHLKAKREADAAKERELERILKSPIVRGPPKNQKDITDFFLREQALARKKLHDSVTRRRERGPDWYEELKKTPHEIGEDQKRLRRKKAERRAKAAEKRAEKAAEKAAEKEENLRQDKRDRVSALSLYNKYYKDAYEATTTLGHSQKRQQAHAVIAELDKHFPQTNQLTPLEQQEWAALFELADNGDKTSKAIVEEQTMVKEMSRMMYVPAVYLEGQEPPPDNETENAERDDHITYEPIEPAHFMGYTFEPVRKHSTKVGPLNPEWVRRFFKGVYVQLLMLKPKHWWPMVVGNTREENDEAPKELMVLKVKVKHLQFDREQCLVKGVASSLYYCGLGQGAHAIGALATKFENLTKEIALKELKKAMRQYVPCIGDCQTFNVRTTKKKPIKKLSIDDLIEKKTPFPTVVIPFGKDGSNNHSFVVVDDLVFDSTQAYALKLCRASLDWICGGSGMASIDVALRFNRGHGTKEKLPNKDRKNW